MKHTTTMTAAVLALMLNLTGCDGPSPEAGSRPSGGAVERIKALLGMESAEPGVVATVDGIPIYLRQVEGLYDMTSLAPVEGRTVTLEEVRADYAECLRTLVEQVLIRRELAVRDRSVSDDDVLRLEETVSSGYDERPGPEFDPWIEDAGLAPDLWREQLRARLELERWQAELARSIAVGEEEVEAYVAAHPDEMVVPAQVEYLLVCGPRALTCAVFGVPWRACPTYGAKSWLGRCRAARRPCARREEAGGMRFFWTDNPIGRVLRPKCTPTPRNGLWNSACPRRSMPGWPTL